MPGAPLSLPDREEISAALIANPEISWAEIGRRIDRHATTVMREVSRHGGRSRYRPALADRTAAKARRRVRPRRLATRGALRDRIIDELGEGRSPWAIWADLVAEGAERVCVETIYAAVFDGTLDLKASACLRTRRPRRRSRQARHANKRPGLPNIAERPARVNGREELGHWEGDQIIGAHNRSSMLWLTERVTRYSIGVAMPDGYAGEDMQAGLVCGLERIPTHMLRSITFDQGPEWACWPALAATYNIKVWFCDPHSPWQRGQIENLNRQWRWWFPRGTDLSAIDQTDIDAAAAIINGQRRRLLDNQSPAALYAAATVH
jgi:IS30 family transposase